MRFFCFGHIEFGIFGVVITLLIITLCGVVCHTFYNITEEFSPHTNLHSSPVNSTLKSSLTSNPQIHAGDIPDKLTNLYLTAPELRPFFFDSFPRFFTHS